MLSLLFTRRFDIDIAPIYSIIGDGLLVLLLLSFHIQYKNTIFLYIYISYSELKLKAKTSLEYIRK